MLLFFIYFYSPPFSVEYSSYLKQRCRLKKTVEKIEENKTIITIFNQIALKLVKVWAYSFKYCCRIKLLIRNPFIKKLHKPLENASLPRVWTKFHRHWFNLSPEDNFNIVFIFIHLILKLKIIKKVTVILGKGDLYMYLNRLMETDWTLNSGENL